MTYVSYCFTLFICGGPCHLSRFKQCSVGPYIPLSTACLFTWGGKVDFFILCIITLSLNFHSKNYTVPQCCLGCE